jgi:hypothetical protein
MPINLGAAPVVTKLIGSIQVQPSTVQPGQSVLIQVLDSSGHAYAAGSGVTITINGVEAPALYCQFTQPGLRPVAVLAVQGSVKEIGTTSVQVEGEPLAFRLALAPAPVPTALPIIQVNPNFASPYTAQFSLGTPTSVSRIMASKILLTAPAAAPTAPALKPAPVGSPVVAPPTLKDQLDKIVTALPASAVKTAPAASVATANGTKITVAARLAAISAATQIAAPAGVSYQWDFGDGQVAMTTSPNVTHNYYPAIKPNQVAHSFDVKCTIVHDNISVTRTLVLQSAYGLCRRMGVAVPYVTGDVYATLQKFAFSGSLIVNNPDTAAITLDQTAVVPVSADPAAAWPAPKFTKMTTPVTIKANSSSGVGVYVTLDQLGALGPNVSGFTVYYSGTMPSTSLVLVGQPSLIAVAGATPGRPDVSIVHQSVPVRFSWHFRIRLTDSGIITAMIPLEVEHEPILATVTAASTAGPAAVSQAGGQSIDPATHTVAIALSADPQSATTKMKVRSAVQAGLMSVAKSAATGSSPATPRPVSGGPPPPSPGPVQAGADCDPDNISDAAAASAASLHLACQLTNETGERSMPGSYQNAQMGDVILAPGGDSPIAKLLRGLTPPQHYAHSGIMTQNQVEITHCTAADSRYGDYTTGIGGVGGIQPDVLQYGWPGCITQTLDNAIGGQNTIDPSGKVYYIGDFNSAPTPEFSLVPPLVIKPLPENEETARPVLRTVAATARSKGAQIDGQGNLTFQKGACYYSLYAYTKPEIGAGFGDPAPAEAGWAQGLTPAVCSAFIWLCMKENGVALLGPGEFESASELSLNAVQAGAAVETTTLDGLFYYSQQDRAQAATVLNAIFQSQILEKEGVFQSSFASTVIASSIADQIMNMFAFGNPNMYGSSAWQNPGDANAVSPDNISWWNPPLFGYAEPVQYLQPHTEQYTSSKWTPYATSGTVSGVVTLLGAPTANVNVQVYDGKSAVTGPNGQYTLTNVPVGSYSLAASFESGGSEYSNGLDGQPVQLTSANPNVTANIALTLLPDNYRDLVVVCQVTSCNHSDGNPENPHGPQVGPINTYHVELGPGQPASGCWYGFDYNGGGYFTAGIAVNALLTLDLSVEVQVIATITDDGSGKVQNTYTNSFNVPQDCWGSLDVSSFEATGTGYTNGPVSFTITASNNQETS